MPPIEPQYIYRNYSFWSRKAKKCYIEINGVMSPYFFKSLRKAKIFKRKLISIEHPNFRRKYTIVLDTHDLPSGRMRL